MRLSHDEEENNLSLSKFESMLKTNKVFFFDSEEFEDIILHYMDTGRMNLAKRALKLGLEQHPKSTGLRLVQVEMLVYEDKLDLAERLLQELYAIEPTNEEIYIQQAQIHSKRDQHEKAIETLKLALKYTDDLADVYSMIGMEYLFMDDLEKAKDYFILCLEEDDQDYSALYNVVYCYDFLEQNEKAIEYLESFINRNPYSEVAWHQLGRQYYALKNYEKAVWAFDYATIIDDTFLGAFMEKGKSLEKLKRYEEAIESFKTTIELDDPTSFALLRIGKCYERLGNREKALKYYHKTVHEDPLLDKGWIAITDFYIRQKNFQKALYYVNKAIGIDGENSFYWKRYAAINEALNFYEEAELGYRRAFESGDINLDTFILWSNMLQFLGEFENGIEILLQASDVFPDEFEIEYRLAGLYYLLGENDKGKFHLSNGLRLNFANHTILEENFPFAWGSEEVQAQIEKFRLK
ncbi:tetratricopeptide repeat protein [Flavobacterium haoranii]|uniref:Tetratricopeptide repeat-containing protein n=1 Tax=Flavobacterium haoranii TaxID=683124 RepID=A0A1M6JV96_9FLAO|nr:tetratricopeptide repeat protein [Flavobacterium haoranii]SHJ50596.1 Tetratricopeptide repeat-containing protein [Flavobacterium haoranii]